MSNRRASVLAMTVGFVLVFTMLGVAVIYQSGLQSQEAQRKVMATKAFWLTEAGIQKSIWELNRNNCAHCTPCGAYQCLSETVETAGLADNNLGDYDAVIDLDNAVINSKGSYPDRGAVNKVQSDIKVDILSETSFGHAIFAGITNTAFPGSAVSLGDNVVVDSYNSSQGDYGAWNNGVQNLASNGDVGSNGIFNGTILFGEQVRVNGDVGTGPGGTLTGTLVPLPYTGTLTHSNNIALPAVVVPSALRNLDDGGTYIVAADQTSTIPEGDYRYSSLTISNNAKLIVNGSVRLYLTGAQAIDSRANAQIIVSEGSDLKIYVDGQCKFRAANNVLVNDTRLPDNLTLYSTYSGNNGVELSSQNNNIYAAIYAPNTDVSLSGAGQMYGAIVGRTVGIGGGFPIHYDEALNSSLGPTGSSVYSIKNWKEI